MRIRIHSENPSKRDIKKVVDILAKGGVMIYPTDTGYSFGCDSKNKKAQEKLIRLKRIDCKKKHLTLICNSLKQVGTYAEMDNDAFKILKKHLPGPYTFILEATKEVSKHISTEKKTIGIKICDNNIDNEIIEQLENPLLSTSLNKNDIDYPLSDPLEIEENYIKLVDVIIDGGYIYPDSSTVIDLSLGEIELIREGKGNLDSFGL